MFIRQRITFFNRVICNGTQFLFCVTYASVHCSRHADPNSVRSGQDSHAIQQSNDTEKVSHNREFNSAYRHYFRLEELNLPFIFLSIFASLERHGVALHMSEHRFSTHAVRQIQTEYESLKLDTANYR